MHLVHVYLNGIQWRIMFGIFVPYFWLIANSTRFCDFIFRALYWLFLLCFSFEHSVCSFWIFFIWFNVFQFCLQNDQSQRSYLWWDPNGDLFVHKFQILRLQCYCISVRTNHYLVSPEWMWTVHIYIYRCAMICVSMFHVLSQCKYLVHTTSTWSETSLLFTNRLFPRRG